MSLRYYSNAPATTLTSACTAASTSLQVTSTSGLPISYPFILIVDRGTNSEEVVLCTNAIGNALTVTRGYDSTTAFAHAIGASVQHGISAIDLREANAHVNATGAVHGVTGTLVGTTDTQTLTHKTLNAGGAGTNTINGFTTNVFMSSDGTGKLVASTKSIPGGALVGTSDAQTLTNKTVALGNNTVSGTKAQFDAACTDQNFATLNAAETLTNKTLTSPTLNTPTLNNPTINTGTLVNTGGTFNGTVTGPSIGTIKPGGTTTVTAIDFGTTSINTGPQGKATVPHILGKNPAAVVATMALNGSVQMRCSVVDQTISDFTVEIRNSSDGSLATNGTYGINWIAIA